MSSVACNQICWFWVSIRLLVIGLHRGSEKLGGVPVAGHMMADATSIRANCCAVAGGVAIHITVRSQIISRIMVEPRPTIPTTCRVDHTVCRSPDEKRLFFNQISFIEKNTRQEDINENQQNHLLNIACIHHDVNVPNRFDSPRGGTSDQF